ncbi:MAG: TIGR03758 family integrating conjugative element protein [Immundisolibacteraceae bacterium]|nr:TIGR03758 family integrating conjugative element protein [Immundisolibacteraceae bacterium]
MTPAQNTVFQNGSGVAPDRLLTAIASAVMVLAFVWVIWISLGTFRAWQEGQATILDVAGALRASIVLMVLGFYLR